MAYIDIIDSTGNDFRYQLPEDGSVLLIGSAEDCSISLPHIADLLPQHCTISLQPEGYVITAAAPGAPLLAEGQPTEAAVLVPHAVYNLGSTMLMYNDAAIAAAPVAEEAPAAETEEAIVEEQEEEKENRAQRASFRSRVHRGRQPAAHCAPPPVCHRHSGTGLPGRPYHALLDDYR